MASFPQRTPEEGPVPASAVDALLRLAAGGPEASSAYLFFRSSDLPPCRWSAPRAAGEAVAERLAAVAARAAEAAEAWVEDCREDLRFRAESAEWPGPCAVAALPLADPAGRPLGALVVLRPGPHAWTPERREALRALAGVGAGVAEREQLAAENERLAAALGALEARHRSLLDAAPFAIWRLDGSGRLVELNRTGARILGRAPSEVIGRPYAELIAEEDRALARAATGPGPAAEVELRVARPSGERRLLSIARVALREEGRVVGVQGIARDVTEERAREAEYRRAQRMANIAPLLSGVCHELNNPLTSIKSFAELMLLDEHSAEDREALEVVRQEAQRAARIVADLGVVARQRREAGTGRGPVALNALVARVLEQRSAGCARAGIRVRTQLAPDLRPAWAAEPQLEQVLVQLLANAEKSLADHAGERLLSVRTWAAPNRVALSVADSGPGIPTEHLEHIFDPFWTTRGPGQGTGLGLSLVHGIVTDHGGHLRVESAPGAGATLTVEIPACLEDPAPEQPGEAAPRIPASLHILVLDDEAPVRLALARYLERRGHLVQQADDGALALQLIATTRFDAVVADVRMPGLGGGDLLRRLRADDHPLADHLLLMSGDAGAPEACALAREADVPLVHKPFELHEIARAIESRASGC